MELRDRLIEYRKTHKLTIEAMFLVLLSAGVTASHVTIGNWLSERNEISPVYRGRVTRFLDDAAKHGGKR